jgi:uncharacterized protein (TIGR02284 family)
MPNEKLISLLNGLIETCKDGEKGFREAADAISIGFYQILFQEYARHRAQFASQLQCEVRKLGADPDRRGTIAGTFHRGWMNLRSAINLKHDDSILAECERGESAALKNYQDALKAFLPDDVRIILETQCKRIESTLKRIKVMEEKEVTN